MNDKDLTFRPQRVSGVLQQSPGGLAVQNIEEQRGVDAAHWQAEAFEHDITMPALDVDQPCCLGSRGRTRNHRRVNVECE